jgi:hypothetical protein
VKILLRDHKTGLYLNSSGLWTERPEDARDFASGQEAIITARTYGLRNVQMHYIFRDASMNFSIALGAGEVD